MLSDYPLIRAYGKYCKHSAAHIGAQEDMARKAKAPKDVVYWYNGRWLMADDIRNVDTRRALGLPLARNEEQK